MAASLSARIASLGLAGSLLAACAAPAAPSPTSAPAQPAAPGAQPTAASAAKPASAATKDLGKIRLTSAGGGISQFVALLAIRKGFFKDEGLEVEHIAMSSQPDATAAVLSGSAEFSAGEAATVLRLVGVEKQPVRGVAVAAIGDGLFLAISKAWADSHGLTQASTNDQKLSSLKGAKIAISRPGSSGTVRTEAIINNRGVKSEDLTLVPTGGGAPQLAAFEAGQVDAFAWTPPFPQRAQKDLGALIVNYEEIPELAGQIGSFHFTTEKMINEKPEVVQAYVNGLGRSFKFLRESRSQALEEARLTFPELDAPTLEQSFDAYYDFLTKGIEPTETSWKNSGDVYNMVSPEPDRLPSVPLSQVFNPTFVAKTKQALNIQ